MRVSELTVLSQARLQCHGVMASNRANRARRSRNRRELGGGHESTTMKRKASVLKSVVAVMAAATLYLTASQHSQHMSSVGDDQTKQYDAMIETLAVSQDYSELVNESVKNNPTLYQSLKSFTLSVSYTKKSRAKRAKRDRSVVFVFSLIIDLLIRVLNDKIWCYSIMMLTLAAVRSNANTTFWGVLVKCKVVYSKTVGVEVAKDLGRRKLNLWPAWASKVVGIAVFDNCAYSLRTNLEHVDESRCSKFYQTINWFYIFAVGHHDTDLLEKGALRIESRLGE